MNVKDDATDKYSLRGRVFQAIRQDILEGKYKENEELRELAIAKQLNVSRTPVREALRQLELEGLVNLIPNRGAFVSGISTKDVQDIYLIRSLLEGLCARLATERITEEQLEELEENLLLAEFNLSKSRHKHVYELDGRFHETLYKASGSKMLMHVLKDFHGYVQQIRKSSVTSHERAEHSVEEHRKIVEAIRNGDADKAEELANTHMMKVMEHLQAQGIDNMLSKSE